MAKKKVNPVVLTRLKGYKYIEKMSPPDRAVHFLNWCATALPGIPISWPIIVKATTGVARMPHIDSNEVKIMRRKVGVIRKKLILQHKRSLAIAEDRQGVFATISADHQAATTLTAAVKRAEGAKATVMREFSILDINAIQNAPLKTFARTSSSAFKAMNTGFEQRLKLLAGSVSSEEPRSR